MAPKFGTSGLRGLAVELTDDLCAAYASAFASVHRHNGTLFIGQDKRDSSPRIAAAVARGASAEGLEIIDCGVLPTPALAGAAQRAGTISIMVTGSHIPADRNGLKFYTAGGEFKKADEAPLAEAVARTITPGEVVANVARSAAPRDEYVARYVEGLPTGALSGKRVGVWLHSSAAGDVLPQILEGLGAEVVTLGASPDFVPVDTEAVDVETRAMLERWVQEHSLDALVSTDGDADRPLMIDDQGWVVPGDILGPITARWCGASDVVTTVSANTMVDAMSGFDRISRTKIGSPYIIAEMEARLKAGATQVAGYEPNGGFLLGWDVTRGAATLPTLMTRDALLPIVATLSAAAGEGRSVSDTIAQLPQRRTATDRLQGIPRETSLAIVAGVLGGDTTVVPDGLGTLIAVDETDGARLSFDSGRILTIRPSGNAPELRCYVEAESGVVADELLSMALNNLRQAVG